MGMLRLLQRILFSIVPVTIMVTTAWSATITGTIANSSGKTGWAYISTQEGLGTSVRFATAGDTTPKEFSIRGLGTNQSVPLKAFLDAGGDGSQNGNDPQGNSVVVHLPIGTDVAVADPLVLNNPALVLPASQSSPTVLQGTGCNFLTWEADYTAAGQAIADSYLISWSDNSTGSPVLGSVTLPAGNESFWLHNGGQAGYYYRVEAVVGSQKAASLWTAVTPRPAGTTVSASFTLSGLTPSGILFAALMDESSDTPKMAFASVAFAASPSVLTFSGVQPGSYRVAGFIDINGNGTEDTGDVTLPEDDEIMVTVGEAPVTGVTVALVAKDAVVTVRTTHSRNDKYEWYTLNFGAEGHRKQPVKVAIIGGAGIDEPVDLGFREWGDFQHTRFTDGARPDKGASYSLLVTYSDNSTAELPGTVTDVLDSFPLPNSPVGPIVPANLQPQFSWQAPANPPAGDYSYSIWLNTLSGYDVHWQQDDISAGQLSIPYGGSPLTERVPYLYTIGLQDAHGNRAEYQTTFVTANAPYITGFTPAAGTAGTAITIDGLNFGSNPTVSIGGVTATIQSKTNTRIVATVPSHSTPGEKSVSVSSSQVSSLSANNEMFYYGSSAIFVGKAVLAGSKAPVSGATLSLDNFASVKNDTGTDGTVTLSGLPANRFVTFKLSKDGFIPIYSQSVNLNGTVDATAHPFLLYSKADLADWNMVPGKSAFLIRVLDASGNPVSGATVSATRGNRPEAPYAVDYTADGITFGGSVTGANGLAVIRNVDAGDYVTMAALKSNWTFASTTVMAYVDSMSQGAIMGNLAAPAPVITSISPTTGTAGTAITINGSNFSNVPGDNWVLLNGLTVQAVTLSTSQLQIVVPAGATSGTISVVTPNGSAAGSQTFTVQHLLTVNTAGTGSGTVTSVPVAISCLSNSLAGCLAPVDQGQTVTLAQTTGAGSQFIGWSGDCTGTGVCSVIMNAARSVTATFDTTQKVKVIGTVSSYYGQLQKGYDAAQEGDEIRVQSGDFSENLNLTRNVGVRLHGGYDSIFGSNSGQNSVLIGTLKISGGSVKVKNMVVR